MDSTTMEDRRHANRFASLVAKRITSVRYMTEEERENFGWYKRAIVITLSDGSILVPQMDDEGNDGGAIMYIKPNQTETIYTI